MKLTLIAAIVLFTLGIGVSYAYAETANIQYDTENLYGINTFENNQTNPDGTFDIFKIISFHWRFDNKTQAIENPPTLTADPVGDFFKRLVFDGAGIFKPIIAPIADAIDEVVKKIDPDNKIIPPSDRDVAIGKLDKCLRGFERYAAWGAFQASSEIENYQNKTRENFTVRDNLSDEIPTLRILKAIEECNAIKMYVDRGMIGPFEANRAIADKLGLDYLGRAEVTGRGNEASLGYALTKTATKEKIEAEAKRVQEWTCKKENMHLQLCPTNPFIGTNRGNSEPIISDNVNTGIFMGNKTAKQVHDEGETAKAARDLTAQDFKSERMDSRIFICEEAFKASAGYGHTSVNWWNDKLKTPEMAPQATYYCDNLLSEEFMERATYGKFDNLKDARDYRLSLDAEIIEARR